jgi:hypothetical protein
MCANSYNGVVVVVAVPWNNDYVSVMPMSMLLKAIHQSESCKNKSDQNTHSKKRGDEVVMVVPVHLHTGMEYTSRWMTYI